MVYDCVVVHYAEIAIKGKNRDFFERKLITNIKHSLSKNFSKVVKRYGRIICFLNDDYDKEVIVNTLRFIPGIAYFSMAISGVLDYDMISANVLKVLDGKNFNTFAVKSRRSNKNFFKNSKELNEELGGVILDSYDNVSVDLTNPDVRVFVDIGEKESLVYTNLERTVGVGGLPVGSSGRVISSLSGGLDSPVASFMLMKRGCEVILCHIHNENVDSVRVREKIIGLSEILSKFQVNTKLFIVPFGDIQRAIITVVPSKLRMIVYRRFMMRIINSLNYYYKLNAKALVTGDSVGQVASQTLDNIQTIREASKFPILSPLIGLNKEEIITLSKDIGTYDTSIIPSDDCCSFMIAKSPETKSNLKEILSFEEKISDPDNLIMNAVKNSELIKFS